MERSYQQVFDDFIHGRLKADEWTHEAHLVACWMTLRDRTPHEALGFLRDSIKAHNCGVGTANTDHSGYHETLTVYYVSAVADASARSPAALIDLDSTSRTAPASFWTKELLFTPQARQTWVDPNLAALTIDVEATLHPSR